MVDSTWTRLSRRQAAVWLATEICLTLLLLTSPAMAQRRVGLWRIAKVNAMHRRQEIEQLQQQLDSARKLLESVTTQGALTQAQLDSARQSALAARRELEAAEEENKGINKKLHEIESKILEDQSGDSEYAQALEAIHLAQHALDAELHRVLRRPPPALDEDESTRLSELAHLTTEERETLAADAKYAEQQAALHLAMDEYKTVRMKLFRANDEWKKADAERVRIAQEKAEGERSVQGAANDSSGNRKELRTAAEIAASARASIAQAQARLQTLGAKEKTAAREKKPNGKKKAP